MVMPLIPSHLLPGFSGMAQCVPSPHLKEQIEKMEKAKEMMDALNIPNNGANVSILDLQALFSSEEKMRELVSKLKLKSFW